MGRAQSLPAKLPLAFLGVTLAAVGVPGTPVGRPAGGAFEDHPAGCQTGNLGEMVRTTDEMVGPEAGREMAGG